MPLFQRQLAAFEHCFANVWATHPMENLTFWGVGLQTDIATSIVGLTKLGSAAMLSFKPTLGHPGDIGSDHDDRNHRDPNPRAPWPGAARALIVAAIVFLICLILLELVSSFLVDWLWFSGDRSFWRLLDDHNRRSRSILRRLFGDRHHPVGEWIARVPLRAITADGASRRLRVENHERCDLTRGFGIHAPSAAMGSRNHLRRLYPCCACRLGRGEKLGCLPAVPLSGALWRERPTLQQ